MPPDGCTGIPWRTPFDGCCDQHDLAYEQEQSKVAADWVLRQCIRASGHPIQAWFVWVGLLTVGWMYYWIKIKRGF